MASSSDFLAEVVERVSGTYEPDEVVVGMELSVADIAEAFEKEFLEWAHNEGFFMEATDNLDGEFDEYN
jgi:hypothetical protein